jgi:hypothetical protein
MKEDPAEKFVRRMKEEKGDLASSKSEVIIAMIVLGIMAGIGLLGWLVYSFLNR